MDFKDIFNKLSDVREYAEENFIPIIRDKSAEFMFNFVKNNNIKNILEIGTAIGYSGSILLSSSLGNLVTVDKNEKSIQIAKETFEMMGFSNRVEVYCEDAFDLINKLQDKNRRFDMIFLDGAKGQYIKYLPILTNLLNDKGVIFADNVLLQGMVESKEKIPHRKRTMVVNLRKYLSVVSNDPYETELLHIEDGMAITKVKR